MNAFFRWLKDSSLKILLEKIQNTNERGAQEVINNPQNVKKSLQQNRGRPVLSFKGDNYGTIIVVENLHIKHGELSLIPTYHKNEARHGSTDSKNLETYVQNGLPLTSLQE